jgi:tetratricopeptide (TPR) repeat protein
MSTILASALLWSAIGSATLAQSQADPAAQQFDAVAERYHTILLRQPRRGATLDMLVRHYLDAGRLDELVARYEKHTREKPDDAAGHVALGLVLERRGRDATAIKAFERAGELAPKDFYPPYCRGLVLAEQRADEPAIAAFREALERKPPRVELMEIHKKLGRLYARQAKTADALQVWSELADLFPDDRMVLEELAELLAEEEQYDEAIRRYERLAELSKEDLYKRLTARVEIGQILVRQGKMKSAVDAFDACVAEVDPDSWLAGDIRRRVEEIFLRTDDLAGLAEYYRERLKRHADELTSMVRLAATTSRLGDRDAALEQYRAAVKLAPTRKDLREAIIDELVRAEKFTDAVGESESLVEKYPTDVQYLRQLGELHIKAATDSNRTEAEARALDVWKSIAAIRPNDASLAVQVAELCRKAAGIGSRLVGTSAESDRPAAKSSALVDAALEHYREAVRRGTGVPQYHEYLGEFLYSLGRDDEAVAAWRAIADPPHDSPENLKRLAQVFAGVAKLDAATETARLAIDKAPDRYDLRAQAADLLVRQKEYDAALEQIAEMEKLADVPFLEDQAITRRVDVYASAGRLADEATKLAEQLASPDATARDFWLAALIAAADRRWQDAAEHLERAVAQKPDDPRFLRLKARAHQNAGDLGGAATQFERLAKLDPKNRTEHLKELVRLQLELGRGEAAKGAADELIRLSPANVDGYSLLAEIQFRLGQHDAGLDTLRRAVRIDPRNVEVRLTLARSLAQYQRADEAIEHYWRSFDLTEETSAKISLAGTLADLYVAAGKLSQLAERFQRLRRDQEDPLVLTVCLVEAYLHAEDFSSARRELAGLLARRPNDLIVMSQLVSLAERMQDLDDAIAYQQKIVAASPEHANLERLANLLARSGKKSEAQEVWTRIARAAKDEWAILAAMDRAAEQQQDELVLALGTPEWTERPDDWRFGLRLAMAHWQLKQFAESRAICETILNLPPSDKYEKQPPPPPATQSASAATTTSRRPTRSSYGPTGYPSDLMLLSLPMQTRESLRQSEGRQRFVWYGVPDTLNAAQAVSTIYVHEVARREKREDEWLDALKQRGERDREALQQLAWVYVSEQKQDGLKPLLEKWLAQRPNDAIARLLQSQSVYYRGQQAGSPSDNEKNLATAKESFTWMEKNRPDLARWMAASYAQALITWGDKDEAKRFAEQRLDAASDLNELSQIMYVVNQLQDADLSGKLLARAEELQKALGGPGSTASYIVPQLFQQFLQQAVAAKDTNRLLESFDRYMQTTQPRVIRPGTMSSQSPYYGGGMFSSGMMGMSGRTRASRGNLARIGQFPGPSGYLEAARLQMLTTVYQGLKATDAAETLVELIDRHIAESDDPAKQCWTMARACVVWWENDRAAALKILSDLAAAAPADVDLALLRARAHAAENELDEALAAMDSIFLPFGSSAKTIEDTRLQIALAASNEDVAKRAALRLFGMRLASNEQVELAGVLRRLGLGTRSEELMKRAERTASSNPNDLVTVMRQYAQTDKEKAASLARQILQQTKRSSRPNDGANYQRQEALRMLRQVGELDAMIAQAEKQLEASPRSIKLLEDLAELHTAAGNEEKTFAIYDRIIAERPDDPAVQYQLAMSLFARRKFAEAIERLGVVWEKDPQTIVNQSHEIGRYYAQAGKLDVLAEHIAKLKDSAPLRQNAYALVNLVQNLDSQNAKTDDIAKLYRVVIDLTPGEYRSNAVMTYANFLNNKGRKADAYELYRGLVLPTAESKPAESQHSHQSGNQLYYFQQLAELANTTKKIGELSDQVRAAADRFPQWRPAGELLLAMLDRRSGKEQTITEMARLYLSEPEFAKSFPVELTYVLREEIANCESRPALEQAVAIWEHARAPRQPGLSDGLDATAQQRLAAIWVKLGDRDKARGLLLEALRKPVTLQPGYPVQMAAEYQMSQRKPIVDALRQNAFYLDAIGYYDSLLTGNLPQRDQYSHVHYQMAELRRSLAECISAVLRTPALRDEAIERLAAELAKADSAPDWAPLFAVNDPPSDQERERFGGRMMSIPSTSAGRRTTESTANLQQLLPSLLQHARETDKLAALATAANERLAANSDNPQAAAMAAMIALAAGKPADAVPVIEKLAAAAEKKIDAAAQSETWLLAQTAIDHAETRAAGRRLADSVAKAAGRRGNVARQEAAQAALAATLADTGDAADASAAVEKMLAERKDPETRLHVAQVYFQQKKYVEGVALLAQIWDRDPDLLFPKLGELVRYYVDAGKMDDLVKSLGAIRDENVRRQYSNQITNLAQQLGNQKPQAASAIKLFRAAIEFAPEGQQGYAASQLNSFLSRMPRGPDVLETYRQIVLPTADSPGRFDGFARPMADLAKELKQHEDLATQCRAAMAEHEAWQQQGELLLAMLARRLGDEKPIEQLAERYRSDAALAKSLSGVTATLRDELSACSGRPAVELALELWQRQSAANRSGGDSYSPGPIAGLWIKLGERAKAREVLLGALRTPVRVDIHSEPRYQIQQDVQRRQSLAQQFLAHGFRVDAAAVYESIVTMDVSPVPSDDYTHQLIHQAADAGRQAIAQIVQKELDETLESLGATLRDAARPETKQPPDLAGYFAVIEPVPVAARRNTPPADAPTGADQFLLPLLEHAAKTGKIDELGRAAGEAAEKFSDHLALAAFDAMIDTTRGDWEHAVPALRSLASRVEEKPALAGQSAVWLAAVSAMSHAETRELGQTLAESVVQAAGERGNVVRQLAAITSLSESYAASGKGERAAELMTRLLSSAKDDAAGQLQLGRLLLGRKQVADGVAALERAWKKDPRMMLLKLAELYPLYADAAQVDELCKSLRAVSDEQLRREHGQSVVTVANQLMNRKAPDVDVQKLCEVAVDFAPEGNSREFALSQLSTFLSNRNRKGEAVEVLMRSVLPPKGRQERLSGTAQRLCDLAKDVGKLDELEAACNKAIADEPGWKESGELLLAMIGRRRDDDSRFEKFAARLRDEPEFARALVNSPAAYMLRRELAGCKSRPCLEVAMDLSQQELDRRLQQPGNADTSLHDEVAQIAVKLGDRAKAREIWLASLEVGNPGYDPDYLTYREMTRRATVAQFLRVHGFRLDAIRLYAINQSIDVPANDPRQIADQLKQQRGALRSLVLQTITDGLDDAVASLESDLQSTKQPPDLTAYFVTIAEPWTAAEREKLPKHVLADGPPHVQLLAAVLAHAHSQGRLAKLAESLSAARARYPNHAPLLALEMVTRPMSGK